MQPSPQQKRKNWKPPTTKRRHSKARKDRTDRKVSHLPLPNIDLVAAEREQSSALIAHQRSDAAEIAE